MTTMGDEAMKMSRKMWQENGKSRQEKARDGKWRENPTNKPTKKTKKDSVRTREKLQ